MTLSTARQLASHAAVVSAFLAMTSAGDFPPWAMGLFLVCVLASLIKGQRTFPLLIAVLTVFTTGALLVLLLAVARGPLDLVVGASAFAAVVTVNRMLARRSAADDPLLYLTALLMLAAGSALSGEVMYGVCFIFFAVSLTLGLTFSQLEQAADQAGAPRATRDQLVNAPLVLALLALSGAALLGAGAFFLLFPRVNAHWFGRHGGAGHSPMVGFSDRVQLGGYGTLRDDPRPALRVRFPEGAPPDLLDERGRLALLWRGHILERFDGQAWSPVRGGRDGRRARDHSFPSTPPAEAPLHVEVEVLPVTGSHTLFTTGTPRAARLLGLESPGESLRRHALWLGRSGELAVVPPPSGAFTYALWASPSGSDALTGRGQDYPQEVRTRDQAPPGLDPRIPALARAWTSGLVEPSAQAQAIRDHLRADYRYTTALPGEVADPLANFLFTRKAGHCEYFSTAMVLLLRTLGVPAREVTGFAGGVQAPGGDYFIVRAGDAHSWAEVYFPGVGFEAFDPTPPSFSDTAPSGISAFLAALGDELSRQWQSAVVDYNLSSQLGLARRAMSALQAARASFSRGDAGRSRSLPWRKLGLALLAAAIIWAIWRRLRLHRPRSGRQVDDEATRAYRKLLGQLAHSGIQRLDSETPLELAARTEGHPAQAAIAELTGLYQRARYEGLPWGEVERSRVRALLRALRA